MLFHDTGFNKGANHNNFYITNDEINTLCNVRIPLTTKNIVIYGPKSRTFISNRFEKNNNF